MSRTTYTSLSFRVGLK